MLCIALMNQKGGVGKTTTAVNLAASLSAVMNKVLLIDCDPQANATSAFGVRARQSKYSSYALFHEHSCVPHKTFIPNLDIIPGHKDLYGVEIELLREQSSYGRLKEAIAVYGDYDQIIIDCPPGLGVISLNAMSAVKKILVPVQCEYYSLEGLSQVLSTIKMIQVKHNKSVKICGILLTMFDKRSSHCVSVAADVRKNLGDIVFNVMIPRNIKIAEAPSYGKPVLFYDVNSIGARAYIELAREYCKRECPNGAW